MSAARFSGAGGPRVPGASPGAGPEANSGAGPEANSGARRGAVPRAAIWAALGLLPLALFCGVRSHYSIAPKPPLGADDARGVMGALRASLESGAAPALPDDRQLAGPLWVTLYLRGDRIFRQRVEGSLRKGILDVSTRMHRDPAVQGLGPKARREVRIKVDLSSGRAPIFTAIPFVFAKSVVPGLDGVGLDASGRRAYLLPDDLYQRQIQAGFQPFFFMHEFRDGMDVAAVVNALADALDLTREGWDGARRQFFRFRVQSFVEAPGGQGKPLPVLRSRVPSHAVDRATVQRAVTRAADYVLRQIRKTGQFHYQYYPLRDRHSPPGDYSLPRHAGTTWFLSLAYGALGHERYKSGAVRAIKYLGANAVPYACRETPYACVGHDGAANLGSAALTVVAIAEYQRVTGDRTFEDLARRLGRFITWMQKESGDFCHQYHPARREKNCDDILLYYTGEASLALAKLYEATGDEAYLEPLERAMDFLVGPKYDFFMGQFFISEDHWTCIAAEALPEKLRKRRYAEFCYEFARLNRRVQVQRDQGLMGDLYGAFGISQVFIPHNTPAGSRTEANVATYLLSQKLGEPQEEIRDTVVRSVRYLVDQQIRPESAYLMPNPEAAVGGMSQTPLRTSVRIDYVQHAAAAMARALPFLPEAARNTALGPRAQEAAAAEARSRFAAGHGARPRDRDRVKVAPLPSTPEVNGSETLRGSPPGST